MLGMVRWLDNPDTVNKPVAYLSTLVLVLFNLFLWLAFRKSLALWLMALGVSAMGFIFIYSGGEYWFNGGLNVFWLTGLLITGLLWTKVHGTIFGSLS